MVILSLGRFLNNKARWLVLSSLLILAPMVRPALAHEIRPAIADITVSADAVAIDISLTLEPLVAGIDLSAIIDTNQSEKAEIHDALRQLPPQDLAAELRRLWPEISSGFQLLTDGDAIALTISAVEVDPVGNIELPRDSRLVLSAELPPGDAPVLFGWTKEYGALVVRQVLPDDPQNAYTGYLTGGQLSDPIPRSGAGARGWLASFASYVAIGFEHIVPKGLDHILFVLGLFFFSLNLRPLLWQVTSFTLAHTVTLAMATLGLVQISPAIVEPLIAASIVYVAVENILVQRLSPWRTAVVFGFGLLHGLGFASVLGEIGLEPAQFLTGLIGFNIGVELGQLAVIGAAFMLVGLWFGSRKWYTRAIAHPASAAIALVGAWWFVERTFF